MKKDPKAAKAAFYFAAVLAAAALSALTILSAGSSGSRTFLFGLTLQRLALFMVPCIVAAAALFFFIRAVTEKRIPSFFAAMEWNRSGAFDLHLTLFLLFLCMLLIPGGRFGNRAAIYERLKPIFFLLCGWGLAGMIAFSQSSVKAFFLRWLDPSSRKPFAIFLTLQVLFLAAIYLTGLGITPGNESWYESAIPILPAQLWSAALIVYAALRLTVSHPQLAQIKKVPNPFIFVLIWALAALAFCWLPTRDHYFAPGPYPPQQQFYPYSDAIFIDFEARTAINGHGFNFGGTVQKPFATYLTYLIQLIIGTDTNRLQLIQSAIFAVVPALLYLFASDLAGKRAGFFAASFFIFQELNAQRARSVLTIHSRLQMSEWVAELLMVLFAYLLYRAIRDQEKRSFLTAAAAAGAVLGAAIYTRFNFFAFLPAAIVLIFAALGRFPRRALKTSLAIAAAVCVTMAPWVVRSYQNTGEFLPEIFGSFRTVIIGQRLSPILDPDAAAETVDSSGFLPNENTLYRKKAFTGSSANLQPAPYPRQASVPASITAESHDASASGITLIARTIANHAFHNLYALFFIAPTTFEFNNLESTFEQDSSPWQQGWDGRLIIETMFCLLINLILIAQALTIMVRNGGIAGLSPIYWAAVYAAALGIARTSGGRYLVPMNWVGCLVFSIGISSIFNALPVRGNASKNFVRIEISSIFRHGKCHKFCGGRLRIFILLGIAIFFGSSFWMMTLIERNATPSPIEAVDPATLRQADPWLDWDQLQESAASNQVYELNGTVHYPRFYYFQTGEKGSDLVYQIRPYSRLVFRLLQNDQATDVLLPIQYSPADLKDGDVVTVFGCREVEQHYLDAFLVIKRNGTAAETVYRRDPGVEFVCPTREPVCPATNECY